MRYVKLALGTCIVLLAVAGLVLVIAYARQASGPAHDPELAERSLLAALTREHPRKHRLSVSCSGIRDGSHFFGCQIQSDGSSELPYGAGVTYDDETDTYRADAGGGDEGRQPLTFGPVK